MAGEHRPEGYLFFYTNSTKSQEILVFPSGPEGLPVQLPSLWPDLSTMGLYQDLSARSSSWTRVRDAVDNVHRRLPPDGRVQGESTGPGIRYHISSAVSGFHDKHREDNHGIVTVTGVPGFYDKLTYQGATTAPEKIKKIQAESRKLLEAEPVSARTLSRLVGKMNATNQVIHQLHCFTDTYRWTWQEI